MAERQITFRVDDELYRKLVEEGAGLGTSPHIMAKEIVSGRYGHSSGKSPAAALGEHFHRQYLARMHAAISAVSPELEALMQRLAHEVLNDRAWAGAGQGGRAQGTPRPKRG